MTAGMTHAGVVASGARGLPRLRSEPGVRDGLGVLGGLAPLGGARGAAVSDATLHAGIGLLTSPLLFGASLQLTALSLLSGGASLFSVVVAIAIVNGRSVFYSASLRSRLGPQPRWFRWSGPYLLVDPLFALVGQRADRAPLAPEEIRRYYLAAGLTIWCGWQAFVATGALVGPAIPPWLGLEFAVPALLIGLLVPGLRCRTSLVAAGAGFGVALAAAGLPSGLGLLVAGAAGALIVSIRESRRC
jgi:predicted branched-subunit amino acid permease